MDLPLPQFNSTEWEADEGQYEGEEGDEEEDEAEYDAEAEAIAKRLGDQLLADIAKAQMEVALAASGTQTTAPVPPAPPTVISPVSRKQKQEAVLMTMRSILASIETDPQARDVLSTSSISVLSDSSNVLAALQSCTNRNSVSKATAKALSQSLLSLAQNDTLFGQLKEKTTSTDMLERGKRKREFRFGETDQDDTTRAAKRLQTSAKESPPDLFSQLSNAIHTVSSAFASLPPPPPPRPLESTSRTHPSDQQRRTPDPGFVSSIHHHLHQIFLFAVTSVPRAPPERIIVLQDLVRFIQMLGILTGIPIGPAADPGSEADIGAAVYPCIGVPVFPPCGKTFGKLYSLRVHHSRCHPSHGPAPGAAMIADRPYRCTQCPASFSRNHDLKRHIKLHERKGWKCGGCDKVFSRPDAIKRHKDRAAKGLGGEGAYSSGDGSGAATGNAACAYGLVFEVEVQKVEGEGELNRRAKLWSGIAAREGMTYGDGEGHGPEEGEISLEEIDRAQIMVIDGVYEHLRVYVSSLTGTPLPPAPPSATHFPPLPPPFHPAGPSQSQPPPPMASLQVPPAPAPEPQPEAAGAESSVTQWLSEEQTRLLEEAIAQAAAQAQAQAEAEAALEEQEEDDMEEDELDVEEEGVSGEPISG